MALKVPVARVGARAASAALARDSLLEDRLVRAAWDRVRSVPGDLAQAPLVRQTLRPLEDSAMALRLKNRFRNERCMN